MSISPASASSRGGRIAGMRTAAHRSERPHHGRHARPDFLETPAMGPSRYSASRPSMSIGLCANWGGRPQVIYKLPYVPYGSNDVQSCQGFALDVALLDRVVARRGVREYKNFPNTQFELRSKM